MFPYYVCIFVYGDGLGKSIVGSTGPQASFTELLDN